MTKLKQIAPYILLFTLSFFTWSFATLLMVGGDGNLHKYLIEISHTRFYVMIAIIAYVLYAITHLILKKILPIYIYKENKKVRLTVFFVINTAGMFLVDVLSLILAFSNKPF